MDKSKARALKAAGWKIGTAGEFLDLSPEEAALIEMKLALADKVKALRKQKRLTQAEFAKMIRSSQSRVAKLEAADRSVSVDLLMRSLLHLGASPQKIGSAISGAKRQTSKRKTA